MRLLTEKTIMELRSLLSQLLKDIRSTYKVDLRMSVESVMEKGKQARIFIEYIEAKMAGHGALALQKICRWADENQIVLGLKASEDFGTAKDKLISIYKHFGFEPIIAEMERPYETATLTKEYINKYRKTIMESSMENTEKKYGLFVYEETPTDTVHIDGMDEYSDSFKELRTIAAYLIGDIKDMDLSGTFTIEIWKNDGSGYWGASGEPVWKKEIKVKSAKLGEAKEGNMLTEKKKTPIMIQRLKNWKKWKGISKEDIEKYATEDEKKKLAEDIEPDISSQDVKGDDAAPEVKEAETSSDDLLANLINKADDATLEALLAIIQEELTSRGGKVDVTAMMPEDEEIGEMPEGLEGIEDENI